ncbi:hypothetical protein HDU92_007426 [Lobulomyces angularis]|nr:hypothetical protein HDU92_007426 [Lobulomyces angularis]
MFSTNAAKTFSDKYKEFNVDFDQNSNHLESSIEVHKKNYNKYLIKETLREYENFGLLNNAQLNAPNVSADYLKENFEECLDLNLNNSVIFVETNVTDILSQELQGEINTVDTSLNQHLADMNLPGLTLLAPFTPITTSSAISTPIYQDFSFSKVPTTDCPQLISVISSPYFYDNAQSPIHSDPIQLQQHFASSEMLQFLQLDSTKNIIDLTNTADSTPATPVKKPKRKSPIFLQPRKKKPKEVFQCSKKNCEAKFDAKHKLESHWVCHSEFKPYVCLICGNNFSRLHDSFRHVRNIHKVLKDFEEHIFEDKNKIILIKQEHTKSLQN